MTRVGFAPTQPFGARFTVWLALSGQPGRWDGSPGLSSLLLGATNGAASHPGVTSATAACARRLRLLCRNVSHRPAKSTVPYCGSHSVGLAHRTCGRSCWQPHWQAPLPGGEWSLCRSCPARPSPTAHPPIMTCEAPAVVAHRSREKLRFPPPHGAGVFSGHGSFHRSRVAGLASSRARTRRSRSSRDVLQRSAREARRHKSARSLYAI